MCVCSCMSAWNVKNLTSITGWCSSSCFLKKKVTTSGSFPDIVLLAKKTTSSHCWVSFVFGFSDSLSIAITQSNALESLIHSRPIPVDSFRRHHWFPFWFTVRVIIICFESSYFIRVTSREIPIAFLLQNDTLFGRQIMCRLLSWLAFAWLLFSVLAFLPFLDTHDHSANDR